MLHYAIGGAIITGVIGGVVGLVVGLQAYVPTAWFAVVEVGLPAAVVGGFLGAIVGAAVASARWAKRR